MTYKIVSRDPFHAKAEINGRIYSLGWVQDRRNWGGSCEQVYPYRAKTFLADAHEHGQTVHPDTQDYINACLEISESLPCFVRFDEQRRWMPPHPPDELLFEGLDFQ